MWKKVYLSALLNLTMFAFLSAQSSSVLDINNIHFRVNSNGILGMDISNSAPGCEVPANSGTHALFAAGLWVGGIDLSNQLHFAGQQYENIPNGDFLTGPLTTDGTASIDPNVATQYDQIWTVSKADVDLHRAFFDCIEDPNCDESIDYPGYITPAYFFDWPAHGDVNLGQDQYLAPFSDRNGDGIYQPAHGDVPCVPGDLAKYFIFNDQKIHAYSGGQPIGLEIHAMVYGYASGDPHINNSVFVHYRIINRGSQTLTQSRLGVFADFDLGNPLDDYLGSDLERNLLYVLNGDAMDEDNIAQGYGAQPPAFGMTVFEGPFLDANGSDFTSDALVAATGTGFGDGLIDNERLGSTVMTYSGNGSGPTGEPNGAALRFSRLAGFWNDGTHLVYGGGGYYQDAGADPNATALMAYPGESDPGGLSTFGSIQAPWSEATNGNSPGDRRGISAMGTFTLEPGAEHELDFAFCYARATSGGPAESVSELQISVDAVRSFYFDLVDDCGWSLDPSVGIDEEMQLNELDLFPSPTDGLVRFELSQEMLGAQLEVLDLTGRLVISENVKELKTRIDLSEMGSGLYLVRVLSEKMIYQGKVIRE